MREGKFEPGMIGRLFALSMACMMVILLPVDMRSEGMTDGTGPEAVPPRGGPSRETMIPSLTGEHLVSDIAYMRFLGDGTPVNGGSLGTYLGSLDVDGDGDLELAMSAPGITSKGGDVDAGILYVLNGSADLTPGDRDLQERSLDLTIRSRSPASKLVGSFASGDLNGDGLIDLIIGAPSWPETGKVCVLWGSLEGFPSDIDLVRITDATPNGNPVGFLRTESYAVIAGYVTTSVLGTMLGKNVMAGDLDGDGFDELVFSFHGWNAVFIVWGGPNKMQFGSQYTYIRSSLQTSQFGHGCLLGDLNGNGALDIVISSPTADDDTRGLTQVGAVHVVFDAGKFRGNSSLQIQDIARPNIYGKEPYDQFGLSILSKDLNRDGRTDLLIGAPGDDGPNNDRYGAGQIMVFYGDEIPAFPTYMVGLDRCDKVVYGAQGKLGAQEADSLGSEFDVGDLDGDGKYELVVGYPGKDGDGTEDAGRCIVYSSADWVGVPGVVADLSKATPRTVMKGDDPYDRFGFQVVCADLNDDAVDDLVISSPGADGPDNQRPGAGEAYLLLGSSMTIETIDITGEAVSDGTLYTGAGNATLQVRFKQFPHARSDTHARVVLDPGGLNISLVVGPTGPYKEGDGFDLVALDAVNTSISVSGVTGDLRVKLAFDWFYYMTEGAKVSVSLDAGGGIWVGRDFVSPFNVVRDVAILGEPAVLRGGQMLPTGHEWFSEGDIITFKQLSLAYSDGSDRRFDGSKVTAALLRDGELVGTGRADGTWSVDDAIPTKGSVIYSILLGHGPNEAPAGFPQDLRPDVGPPFGIEVKVDLSNPEPPQGVLVIPDQDRRSNYDDDTSWLLVWNASMDDTGDPPASATLRSMDRNGSGIRSFKVQVNDQAPFLAKREGGLQATYFRDGNFTVHGMMRTDPTVAFTERDWGMWGPGPERVPPYGFSVRWDGWVHFPKDRYYRFMLSGTGEAMLMMDGSRVLDWNSLSATPSTPARYRSKDEMVRVELYMRQSGPTSSISFLWDDDRGDMVPVPSGELYHVSNMAKIVLPGPGAHTVKLTSEDWASRSSRPGTELLLILENDPPGFNLTDLRTWYGETSPTVELVVFDPSSFGTFGSGVNTTSLELRLRRTSDQNFGEWSSKGRRVTPLVEGPELPLSVRVSFKLDLTGDWNGQVQFRARDGAGNEMQSSSLFLGIDMVPPAVSLLAPNLTKPLSSSGFDMLIRCFDGKGSGVSGDTVSFRLRSNIGMEWGEWTLTGERGTGPELLTNVNLRLLPGSYSIQFRAGDTVGNVGISPEYRFNVIEPKADLPPVPIIRAPLEGAVYRVGYPVPLDASGTTDDGQGRYHSLVLTWFSNVSGYLGSGRNLTTYKLTAGRHRITLYADDGSPGHNVTATVNITMKDYDIRPPDDDGPSEHDGPDLLTLLAVFALLSVLIAALVVFLMMRYKARREEEIRLEFAERTEDDDYYDERTIEEERALGIRMDAKVPSAAELRRQRKALYGEE